MLIAFGGAGPLHANRLAAETGIATTLIPPSPGTTSALGLLVSDLKHDYAVAWRCRAERLDPAAVQAAFGTLETAGRTILAREHVAAADMAFVRQADLRGALVAGASLRSARYDSRTRWPRGLDPEARGAVRDRENGP